MKKVHGEPVPDAPPLPNGTSLSDRRAVQGELDRRSAGQRLTPAHRRIAQCMVEQSAQLGFLSSTELAALANVSQPSVTRFSVAMGFRGFLEMRRFLRQGLSGDDSAPADDQNRYQGAALAEASNLGELAHAVADQHVVKRFGSLLAKSRPLPVLGLRASAGLATQFTYFASKIHPDVRLLTGGGSLIEDQLEQCRAAGATALLSFLIPLYPRESLQAIKHAKKLGMSVALVTDPGFADTEQLADVILAARVNTRLVFDSYAGFAVIVSMLLDAMCDSMGGEAQRRLEQVDISSKRRKVFMR